MKTTDLVLVHTQWQGTGDVHTARCGLRVTSSMRTYSYQQNGRTYISREPLHRVEFLCTEGHETGVASLRDLAAAGIKVRQTR